MKTNVIMRGLCILFMLSCPCLAADTATPYRVAVLHGGPAGNELATPQMLMETLRGRGGADVKLVDAALLTKPEGITTKQFDLLVLPNAAVMPLESKPVLQQFVENGGDILALGAPAFTESIVYTGTEWLSYRSYREKLTTRPATHMLCDFENEDLSRWQRNCLSPRRPFVSELVDGYQGKALHMDIQEMEGWDSLQSPPLNRPFPPGHTLTSFWVKGKPGLQNLAAEWREKDGSRWFAVFPVTEEWQHVVLSPNHFHYWQSAPNRGNAGDQFKPENAVSIAFGLAWTHTGQETGRHEFFIDELGTMADPYGEAGCRFSSPPLAIEGLCPPYKFYELNDVIRLSIRGAKDTQPLPLPKRGSIKAHHPRPTGKGLGRQRGWRWIPLLDATGSRNEWRGAPASMYIDFAGPEKGSIRAAVSVSDSDWYRHPAVREFLGEIVERMAGGIFLEEAGASAFTCRPEGTLNIGAYAVSLTQESPAAVTLQVAVTARDKTEPVYQKRHEKIAFKAGRYFCSEIIRPEELPPECTVSAVLRQGDRVLDEISHELCVWPVKAEGERQFVTTRDGHFYSGGRKWFVHGVNYMPSTGIGVENHEYFEYWLNRKPYDPEFIQRDLERCRATGLNSISVFIYHNSIAANNLLDLLRRCDKLGLKVNLSIRPGTPMSYDPKQWGEIITHCRLWEIDTVYAYDIAWEPFFGNEETRQQYDLQWQAWVEKKYGTIADAEKAWSVPGPKRQDRLTTPNASHLGVDGPHRRMVADYRRFVDDLVHDHYAAAADRIRKIDPNHLISFRMIETSNPTYLGETLMPYDFKGLARAMDFLSPEAYGRIGMWDRVRDGMFEVAYARMCAPAKPVIWAEAGMSAWSRPGDGHDPALAQTQAAFFGHFYDMVLRSGSNGVVWWWYPGGYRTNENSDYGIINPDGSDRLCTKVIREHASKMLADRELPKPTTWIDIDRDADARGLYGEYERVKEQYWKAVDAGLRVGLREKGGNP